MSKNVRSLPCCYCGEEGGTADHVIPKGFFPPPLPSNLITAPCCEQCNEGYSKIDGIMRGFVACADGRSVHGEWALKRFFSEKNRKTKGFKKIGESVRLIKLQLESGEVEERPVVSIDSTTAENFLVRVTKGLIHELCPEIYSTRAHFAVFPLNSPTKGAIARDHIQSILPSIKKGVTLGNGVYDCRWGKSEDGHEASIWIHAFYRAAFFVVIHERYLHDWKFDFMKYR